MRQLLTAKGRATRAAYWKICVLIWLLMIAILLPPLSLARFGIDLIDGPGAASWISTIALASACLYALALFIASAIRRLHDRGKTGWWMFLFLLLPYILFRAADPGDSTLNGQEIALYLAAFAAWAWGFIELGFAPGTREENRFGPNPLTSSDEHPENKTEFLDGRP